MNQAFTAAIQLAAPPLAAPLEMTFYAMQDVPVHATEGHAWISETVVVFPAPYRAREVAEHNWDRLLIMASGHSLQLVSKADCCALTDG